MPTILRTSNPDDFGHFGLACSIDNGRAAVCSKEIFHNPTEYGGVAIFERDSTGRWLQTQILRASQEFPPLSSTFAKDVEIVGDSMMVLSGGSHEAYELRYVGGRWVGHEIVPRATGTGLGQGFTMAYDGVTLVTGHKQAGNPGGAPGAVFFYERQGTWTQVQSFTAPQLGVHPLSTFNGFSSALDVDGDVAAVGAVTSYVNGFDHVGTVFVMRRTNGVWALEQRIDHPYPNRRDLYFGYPITLCGDDMFTAAGHDGWTSDVTAHIFHYHRNSQGTWELVDDIEPTIGPGQSAYTIGFCSQMQYVPPTLFVGSSAWRVPGAVLGDPFGGYGAVHAFERCDGFWNQRLVMTTPYRLLSSQIGGSGLDYDGQTVIAGGRFFTGYEGQNGAPGPNLEAGLAAVIDTRRCPQGRASSSVGPVAPGVGRDDGLPCGAASLALVVELERPGRAFGRVWWLRPAACPPRGGQPASVQHDAAGDRHSRTICRSRLARAVGGVWCLGFVRRVVGHARTPPAWRPSRTCTPRHRGAGELLLLRAALPSPLPPTDTLAVRARLERIERAPAALGPLLTRDARASVADFLTRENPEILA
ncbi:MAG: hypothetical protein R3F49_23260 [Planctomycetota bacterium]